MRFLSFRADDGLIDILDRAALDDGRTRSDIIRRACHAYLDDDDDLGPAANGSEETTEASRTA